MLSRCYGYYLVYTECSSVCLATAVHWMFRTPICLSAITIVETTQQRIAIHLKRSSLCYSFSSPPMPNHKKVAKSFNKPTYASLMLSRCYGYYLVYTECLSISLATIYCTLIAWVLRTPNLVCANTIIETTQHRTAIVPKADHHCAALHKPADAQ